MSDTYDKAVHGEMDRIEQGLRSAPNIPALDRLEYVAVLRSQLYSLERICDIAGNDLGFTRSKALGADAEAIARRARDQLSQAANR